MHIFTHLFLGLCKLSVGLFIYQSICATYVYNIHIDNNKENICTQKESNQYIYMYIYYSMHHLSLCLCVGKSVCLFVWTSFFHSSLISFFMFLSVCVPLSQSMLSNLAGTWLNCAFCSTLVTWYGILSFPVVSCPIHQCICFFPGYGRTGAYRCLSASLLRSPRARWASPSFAREMKQRQSPAMDGAIWCDLQLILPRFLHRLYMIHMIAWFAWLQPWGHLAWSYYQWLTQWWAEQNSKFGELVWH